MINKTQVLRFNKFNNLFNTKQTITNHRINYKTFRHNWLTTQINKTKNLTT